jgi:hypothetical protein
VGRSVSFSSSRLHYYSLFHCRATHVVLDDGGHIIAVLVGWPQEQPDRPAPTTYLSSCERAADLLETLRAQNEERFYLEQRVHRRGVYSCLSVGLNYGNGLEVTSVSIRWPDDPAYSVLDP